MTMSDAPLLIDGLPTPGVGWFECRNPLSGEVVTRAAAASVADACAAADAAATAFAAYSSLGPRGRRDLINRAADGLMARRDDLVAAMVAETGAGTAWTRFNVQMTEGLMREAAASTTRDAGEVLPSEKSGCLSYSVRVPHGVCLAIAPWNAPLILGMRSIIWPLACGNTVILKASELCPRTHYLLGEILVEAGFPKGSVNVINNRSADAGAVVSALIAHKAVRHINFTGSSRVGSIIAQEAGKHLKPVLLELGGKAPLIVLDDADLDAAVNAAAFGAFMHQGQICMSTERVIVDRSVADAFAEKFAVKAQGLAAGDPRFSDAPIGSLISNQAAEHIEALITDAIAKGAKRLSGGRRAGTVVEATVLDHVTPEMRIYGEETFGPVTCMVRADDEHDAVRIANDTEFGLSASVYSRNVGRALNVAKRVESGIFHINGPTVQDEPTAPFGGVKASGYGRFGGRSGLDAFTMTRWMTIETEEPHYPF
jgi:acyl-CoA reductase-like NAD-dependent aldehyde dehydrogenase